MSKENLTLYQKLHKIQCEVIGLGKNKKGNNYEYVTGSKVLEHIKPLMNDLGLLLKQEVLSIDNQRIDYKTGVNTQYEKPKSEILSKVMMKFTWIDIDTGDKDENLFGSNGQNDWDKGVGSALTYAERYFLLKFFHINTDEDDIDNPDRQVESVNKAVPAPPVSAPMPPTKPKVPKSEDEKPWLNKMTANKKDFTPQWMNVISAISEGKLNSMADIRKHYRVSKELQSDLESNFNLIPA